MDQIIYSSLLSRKLRIEKLMAGLLAYHFFPAPSPHSMRVVSPGTLWITAAGTAQDSNLIPFSER